MSAWLSWWWWWWAVMATQSVTVCLSPWPGTDWAPHWVSDRSVHCTLYTPLLSLLNMTLSHSKHSLDIICNDGMDRVIMSVTGDSLMCGPSVVWCEECTVSVQWVYSECSDCTDCSEWCSQCRLCTPLSACCWAPNNNTMFCNMSGRASSSLSQTQIINVTFSPHTILGWNKKKPLWL